MGRCPAYLTSKANDQAAKQFKAALLKTYGTYVKAWRTCLDIDSSNNVAWHEFYHAANRVKFNGDIAGAWRALDDDVSGFITLREIDPESAAILSSLKRWADDEFGSVKTAFRVLDTDHSGTMDFKEFQKAFTFYGFHGNKRRLFKSLDIDGTGSLSMDEISFLDSWEKLAAEDSAETT